MKTKTARIQNPTPTQPRPENQAKSPAATPLRPAPKPQTLVGGADIDESISLLLSHHGIAIARADLTPAQFQAMQQFAAQNHQGSLDALLEDTLGGSARTWQDELAAQPAAPAPPKPEQPVFNLEDAVNQALALMHLLFEADSWATESGELSEDGRDKYVTGWQMLAVETEENLARTLAHEWHTARQAGGTGGNFKRLDELYQAATQWRGLLHLLVTAELLHDKSGIRTEDYNRIVNLGLRRLVSKTTARLQTAWETLHDTQPAALSAAA